MPAALYRKYRPEKFSDVIGQQPIVKTLSNAVKYNRVNHAYLFAGPRGTGKTTMARILAMAVNCVNLSSSAEPCLKCEICRQISRGKSLDVIEIDAASNTGVDNIRELRETVKLPPAQSKYKVYIIDEVHMLSIGAFNALLKTLEEPPQHAIFILATTEIHKLPETILSRCQRFDFSRLSLENIIKKLSIIARREKVKIEKEALEIIALAAEGGMRDAESLLSQIMSLEDKEITSKEVEEILGTADRRSIEKMAGYLLKKNIPLALSLVDQLVKDGYDPEFFSKSLLNYFRQLMLVSVNPKIVQSFSFEFAPEQIQKMETLARKYPVLEILKIISLISEAKDKIRSSFIPQLPLEMAIVKIGQRENPGSALKADYPVSAEKTSSPKKKFSAGPELVDSKQSGGPDKAKDKAAISKNAGGAANNAHKKSGLGKSKPSKISLDSVKEIWNNLLVKVEPLNHSISAILADCQPAKLEENTVFIAVRYGFYKDRINEDKNKKAIEEILGDMLKHKVNIKAVTEEEAGIKMKEVSREPKKENGVQSNLLLSDAMKMMGGKIVE